MTGYVTDFSSRTVVLIIVTQPVVCVTAPLLLNTEKSRFAA